MIKYFKEYCTIANSYDGKLLFEYLLKVFPFLKCCFYKCSKMRCTGKMAPPDENLVNAHSQHRQNFSSGPGTSNF